MKLNIKEAWYKDTMVTGRFVLIFAVFVMTWSAGNAMAAPSLQAMIDAAKAGDVITPPPGTYEGPITIRHAIVLDGQDAVTIDAGGKGSVVLIETNGVTLRNLRLTNSGALHNDIDAGIQVRGSYNVIKDNLIDDVLFGIDLGQADNNVVRRNIIRSKPYDLGIRGDAIRLWYSKNNRIEENDISHARDMVVWYSQDNVIRGNTVRYGRYGLHFMYAQYNVVEDNVYEHNSVGVFLMYSDGVVLKNNRISHGLGATGMGIGMKESSDVTLENNEIVYCATGIYLDVSPFQPDTTNRIHGNRIAFNSIGILFHNDWLGNEFRDNRLNNNAVQVSVNAKASARRNDWTGNFWDDYRGFDRNGDGIGDSPHKMRVFADQLWMDVPMTGYYRASPLLALIDFLERLAPFSEPIELLSDNQPKMFPDAQIAAVKTADDEPESGRIDPFGLKQRLKR